MSHISLTSIVELYTTLVSLVTQNIQRILRGVSEESQPQRIYNPIMAMGFSAMFTFQLDNTKR